MHLAKTIMIFGLLGFSGMNAANSGMNVAMATITRANSEWVTAMRSGDVETIVKPYAEDAVFVTVAGESIRGREAIKQLYRDRFAKAAVVSASIHHEGAAAPQPGLVYEWGTGTVETRAPDGTVRKGGGPYLTVWKLDGDGAWKIVRNVVL